MTKILLVEDDHLNREMFSRRLERKGFQVVVAADGREALNKARAEMPDLILMDLTLPLVDGWEVTRQIKASPEMRSIPVIALTAHAMVGDREKALQAGCDEYETKPADLTRLLHKVQVLLEKTGGNSATPTPARYEAVSPGVQPEILIVDDNVPNREMLGRRLERENYRVTCVGSGVEAIDLIGQRNFDLVLLDLMMPEMNGLEVLSIIRSSHAILDLPVVIVTAKDQGEDMVAALKAGANDYIARPFNFAPLLARLETQLHLSRLRMADGGLRITGGVQAAGPGASHRTVDPSSIRNPQSAIRNRETLADYEILGELGRGGMGVVYKARHLRMDRIVALKVIDREHLNCPSAIKCFYQEIRAAAQLAHRNIVMAFDAGQFGDTHFFAMEFVPGMDLGQLVWRHGPLPVKFASDCIIQAAEGLQHAHERGLVHRDVKPSNLRVAWDHPPSPEGGNLADEPGHPAKVTIKILDMGLALLYETEESAEGGGLTRVVGTADYMAPEQWMNAHQVDIRADLYSLGGTFYFLLTGQVPFPGAEPMEKMLKHHLDEPTPVEQIRPEVPAAIAEVVRRLMAKQPEQRYQKPIEVAEALRRILPQFGR
jgi:CheY-like chemotaxis protein